ncbi:hypothetical protein B0T24DRAFT_620379 [Lasiosphaeria ovina]|uniref:Uncharacterized protein n=1 Tax=Lasiosphaeria ovina TaxID=92902 RepID=A0AAE0NAR1_9PEZI|nr:hypothetical protein B0T24DRAFT_620379 [Lasiosphaeria ovina]
MEELDLLILGAGWTATFLIPLLRARNIQFAATTSDGRAVAGSPTIAFRFDAAAPDQSAIAALPRARYVLVTFPLVGAGPSRLLVDTYEATHRRHHHGSDSSRFRFIQLGSTGVWQGQGQSQAASNGDGPWLTRRSPYNAGDKRAVAEDELLALGGCVLELAGLWGGARDPRNWVGRVAATKDTVRGKTSLHLIHGVDVARAIAAVVAGGDDAWASAAAGQRWMLTDGFVYDWWALLAGWADVAVSAGEGEGEDEDDKQPTEQARWVYELMVEEGVRALPRSMERLGRCYDSREFWATFGLAPLKARV